MFASITLNFVTGGAGFLGTHLFKQFGTTGDPTHITPIVLFPFTANELGALDGSSQSSCSVCALIKLYFNFLNNQYLRYTIF